MRGAIAALLVLAVLGCGNSGSATHVEAQGPEWITLSGTYRLRNLDGRDVPLIVGADTCHTRLSNDPITGAARYRIDTVSVYAMSGRLVFAPGVPGEPSPFESSLVSGIREDDVLVVKDGRYVCGGTGWTSTSRPQGTYRADSERLYLTWTSSAGRGGWITSAGLRFLNAAATAFEGPASVHDSTFVGRFVLEP